MRLDCYCDQITCPVCYPPVELNLEALKAVAKLTVSLISAEEAGSPAPSAASPILGANSERS